MQNTLETANRIYFSQVPLRPNEPSHQNLHIHSAIQFSAQQLSQMSRINDEYQTFEKTYEFILGCTQRDDPVVEKLCKAIRDYVIYLVKYEKEEIFFQHSVEKKFIALLLQKMQYYRFLSDIVKAVFSSLEYLLRAITKEDQYVYFMVCINKEGFLTAKYQLEEDDAPYVANFLKLLTRKINEDEKYLNIFFNQKEPEFPLLLNLLRFHNQKDQILRTSVGLTLIEISSNQSKMIQKYISNFPFIMFYPIYVYQIYNSFLDAISQNETKSQQGRQTLKTTLKFMEDFVQNKERQAIEMYSNCFMTLIGRYVYKELVELSPKTQQRVIRMLKIFYQIVVKDISILKIKIGLGQFFTKKIGKNFSRFLKSRTHHMDFTSWLSQECKPDIRQHCESIFPHSSQVKKQPKSSFIKMLNSYIPHTKDNWLYHEVKKISELVGFQIEMNREVNGQEYYGGSYLKAIELDMKGEECDNEAYERLLKHDSQQILFYYLQLIRQLKVPLKRQGLNNLHQTPQTVIQLLTLLNRSTSLSILKSFYRLILLNHELYINETKNNKVKLLYENVLERLIYFILTEGWNVFWNRSKVGVGGNQEGFSPDIFRDLECDIVFFVALRHMLGTKNSESIKDEKELSTRDTRRVETKANCLLLIQNEDNTLSEQPIQIILDGQYIKLLSQQQKSICRQNIPINRCFIHQHQGSNTFEIVQKENNENPHQQYFLLEFLETPIKNYISKEVRFRKEIVMDLELKLRLMMFEFGQGQGQGE